ncbi:MAG: helix-turn-helix domain-containing protein [Paracoccaceae bacterium]|nr:helix-turn-helix domain-containing protein [Paracoccaceae bacterium]
MGRSRRILRNKKNGQCNPSQTTLAVACNVSVSTINLHLRALENEGLIKRKRHYDEKTKAALATRYEFPKFHAADQSLDRIDSAAP